MQLLTPRFFQPWISRRAVPAAIVAFALILASAIAPVQRVLAQTSDITARVPAIKPVVKEVVEYDEYTGRFAAVNRVELRARVSGYLAAVHFAEGQLVKAGDLLFAIDPRPFQIAQQAAQAEIDEMQAALKLAHTEANRARELRKKLAVSQEDLDQRIQAEVAARARLSRAESALAQAELNLEFSEVRAPIPGRIGRRMIDVGNLVSGGDAPGTLLTTIVQEDPVHFYFEVSEADYLRYSRLGQSGARPSSRNTPNAISVKLLDEDQFLHHGVMDFVDNEANATTGTIQGRAVLSNPDGILEPGLFGRVRLLGSGMYEAVLVPDAVLQFDQSRQFVFVINADKVIERKWVTPGPMIDGLRIIREGLDGSELVVAGAYHRVRTGETAQADIVEVTPGPN